MGATRRWVMDMACSKKLGSASYTLKVLPAALPVSLKAATYHVGVNQLVTMEALTTSGTSKVSACSAFSPTKTEWVVVLYGAMDPVKTDTSGCTLKVALANAGTYWVHFMLQDAKGAYGFKSTQLMVK